jgi:hypothetical protein
MSHHLPARKAKFASGPGISRPSVNETTDPLVPKFCRAPINITQQRVSRGVSHAAKKLAWTRKDLC